MVWDAIERWRGDVAFWTHSPCLGPMRTDVRCGDIEEFVCLEIYEETLLG